MYLLDTNILSALVRDPHVQPLLSHIARVGDNNLCTSVIVAAELRYGAAKKGSDRLKERVEQILAPLPMVTLTDEMTHYYAALRMQLEARGEPIGGNDLLIAAQALCRGDVLVTDNEREFRRVTTLVVENWLYVPEIALPRLLTISEILQAFDALTPDQQADIATTLFNAVHIKFESHEAIFFRLGPLLDARKDAPHYGILVDMAGKILMLEMMARRQIEDASSRLDMLKHAGNVDMFMAMYRDVVIKEE